jgi:hypothetical protein
MCYPYHRTWSSAALSSSLGSSAGEKKISPFLPIITTPIQERRIRSLIKEDGYQSHRWSHVSRFDCVRTTPFIICIPPLPTSPHQPLKHDNWYEELCCLKAGRGLSPGPPRQGRIWAFLAMHSTTRMKSTRYHALGRHGSK